MIIDLQEKYSGMQNGIISKIIKKFQAIERMKKLFHNSNSQFTVPTRFPAFMLAKIKKFDCPELDTSILDWKLKSN